MIYFHGQCYIPLEIQLYAWLEASVEIAVFQNAGGERRDYSGSNGWLPGQYYSNFVNCLSRLLFNVSSGNVGLWCTKVT